MKNPFRKISKCIEKMEKDTFDEKKIKNFKEKIKKIQRGELGDK